MPQVLIIDDEEDLLEMVCFALAHDGMEVTGVKTPSEFFLVLKNRKPDIILMDIYLGLSDGRDICRQIKQDSLYSNIPVLLYSAGNISSESIGNSLADDFILKPFNLKDLADKILELTNKN